jgi:hypothetical protein
LFVSISIDISASAYSDKEYKACCMVKMDKLINNIHQHCPIIGELFLSMVEEIKDVAFENALELILFLFIDKICQSEPDLQEKLYVMAELFIDNLPEMMRNQMKKVS